MSVDEDAIVKDYESGVAQNKILKKHGISELELGIILGKKVSRSASMHIPPRYADNSWGVQKNHHTQIPRDFREEIKPGQILEWSKVKKGEFTVRIT